MYRVALAAAQEDAPSQARVIAPPATGAGPRQAVVTAGLAMEGGKLSRHVQTANVMGVE